MQFYHSPSFLTKSPSGYEGESFIHSTQAAVSLITSFVVLSRAVISNVLRIQGFIGSQFAIFETSSEAQSIGKYRFWSVTIPPMTLSAMIASETHISGPFVL